MTFDGRRCYCEIPVFLLSSSSATMHVLYKEGDEERYEMVSEDGKHYQGSSNSGDGSRVEFTCYRSGNTLLFAGLWKCGGRQGEWYLCGTIDPAPGAGE